MSQDIVADALNMIRNAKKARKDSVRLGSISNLMIEVLKIMKQKGAIKKYKINSKEKSMDISLGEFIDCKAIKPRFSVKNSQVDRYVRRFLPARSFGTIIISTNKGLMTHEEVLEKKTGGSLMAYFY